jgi:DNA-binding IclR family transcriptional regulator
MRQNEADSGVKSAERVIDIFEYFAGHKQVATLAQIAAAIEIPKSSCLALLSTLEGRGYLYRLGDEPRYYPSPRWLTHARAVSAHDPVGERIRPHMQRLRDELHETIIFANLSGKVVQYLEVVESDRVIRYVAAPSTTRPVHPSASGRALLSLMPIEERKEFVKSLSLDRYTETTTTSARKLLAEVEEGLDRGWYSTIGQYQDDIVAVASGVRLSGGSFALVVGAPRQRAERAIRTIGKALHAAASIIEASEGAFGLSKTG